MKVAPSGSIQLFVLGSGGLNPPLSYIFKEIWYNLSVIYSACRESGYSARFGSGLFAGSNPAALTNFNVPFHHGSRQHRFGTSFSIIVNSNVVAGTTTSTKR